jgi:lipopolysaccharide transport system ATP-binding protein
MLKILSRVTAPTSGQVKVKGRIASLLEVGTGFHPELTGRENIYLNGAILGMTKEEVRRKFDEIVAFAEIEKFIDTPVKRYSSGMYVRLAFAVAAHLESEILLVDEVLAVGDAEFQKKCLGKMGVVASKEGRTVLFVSHNMGAIQRLCRTTCLLRSGYLDFLGLTSKAVNLYLSKSSSDNVWINTTDNSIHPIYLESVKILNDLGIECSQFPMGSRIYIEMHTIVSRRISASHLHVMIDYNGINLFRTFDTDNLPSLLNSRDAGLYTNKLIINSSFLKPGKYEVSIDYGIRPSMLFDKHIHVLSFEIIDPEGDFDHAWSEQREGIIRAPVNWEYSITNVDKMDIQPNHEGNI